VAAKRVTVQKMRIKITSISIIYRVWCCKCLHFLSLLDCNYWI